MILAVVSQITQITEKHKGLNSWLICVTWSFDLPQQQSGLWKPLHSDNGTSLGVWSSTRQNSFERGSLWTRARSNLRRPRQTGIIQRSMWASNWCDCCRLYNSRVLAVCTKDLDQRSREASQPMVRVSLPPSPAVQLQSSFRTPSSPRATLPNKNDVANMALMEFPRYHAPNWHWLRKHSWHPPWWRRQSW